MTSTFSELDGILLAARYAFMPNRLKYCGGDRYRDIFGYLSAGRSDQGLRALLEEFATMYPYLRLIAEANKIIDPFDYRVVEAYWLGNRLLNKVTMNDFYRYLVETLGLKKKFQPAVLEKVFGKIPLGARPHHSWHVLSIPKRTGHVFESQTLETVDSCRITPGQVEKTEGGGLVAKVRPLKAEAGRLKLGEPVSRRLAVDWTVSVWSGSIKPGDWISLHWNWVCDRLTPGQAASLQKWTDYNLRIANWSNE